MVDMIILIVEKRRQCVDNLFVSVSMDMSDSASIGIIIYYWQQCWHQIVAALSLQPKGAAAGGGDSR